MRKRAKTSSQHGDRDVLFRQLTSAVRHAAVMPAYSNLFDRNAFTVSLRAPVDRLFAVGAAGHFLPIAVLISLIDEVSLSSV